MQFAFDIKEQMDALTQEVSELQKKPGGPHGYRLRRIILANFWLYGLQVFEIPHGRLLLAGNNASGKSTVLTAALPLALEGSLRPERLDTFGGKHKHAEYYVLGDEASSTSFSYSKRTSYIALEFEWCSSNAEGMQTPDLEVFASPQEKLQDKARYLTIGVSLYGNEAAATRIQPMYFLITDGSRLIENIKLTYIGTDNQTRTYSQHDFKEHLKDHGMICDTQEKYAREVSKQLFGFDDPSRFRKLVELLLVLRRPNPSDGLTVNAVQQHLTDALPSIPGDIAQEAVETIGEIENLQQQIVQLDQEYQAVNDLHNALQNLTLSKVRNAGFHYKMIQQSVEQLDKRIATLHRELADIELHQQKETRAYEEMRSEKEQVTGRISAIEMGDGVKAAQQVIEAQGHVKSTSEQLAKQQKSLERAQGRLHNYESKVRLQYKSFQDQLESSEQHMQHLSVIIEKKALWYEVAEQFQRGIEYMRRVTSVGPDTVEIIQNAASLTLLETKQRLKWLEELNLLHQEKENLDFAIDSAQIEEGRWSREADKMFTQFKAELGNFYGLSHQIEQILESISSNVDSEFTDIGKLTDNHISQDEAQSLEEKTSFEDIDDAHNYVEQCAAQLQQHKNYIEMVILYRNHTLKKWKQEVESLQLEKIEQQSKLLTKEREYQRKERQPEAFPAQPEHRKHARERLAKQNIQTFPLYSLVDMVPGSESEDAGRIEHMLEDTGLLDALVILDADAPMADSLLQTEELSDYRLNAVRLEQLSATNAADISSIPAGCWLQFDPAVRDVLPTTYEQWEVTVKKLIPLIESLLMVPTNNIISTVDAINTSNRWQHGLLTGQSSKGSVQFIGKMARQRTRQQELANLALEITTLTTKLEDLAQHLTQREVRYEKFSIEQDEIRTLLDRIGLPFSHQTLGHTCEFLNTAHKNYKDAQEQTRRKRHEQSQITMKLVRQSGPIVVFTHEHEKVRAALRETYELGPQASQLQSELQALITLYKEMQETEQDLIESRMDESENLVSYNDLHNQLIRYTSILEGLQEIVDSPETKDLTEKLALLRTRAKQLENDILTAAKDISTFAERTKSTSDSVIQKELELQTAQVDMRQKQFLFKDLLSTYPTPELQEVRELVNEGKYAQAVVLLQINAYTLERLQEEQSQLQNMLNAMHQTHMGLLHEYGPDLDQKTSFITFSQTNCDTPFELLSLLDSNRKKQQDLLKDNEVKLFEGFLLRRMTEVLHTHIQEAKAWVDKINEPLRTMSTVQDHYELEWQAKPRPDETKLGSYLAKQQKLLSKPLLKLTEAERELLKGAFKQEIKAMWNNQDESSSKMNYEQRLQRIFDYRQWFQFRVYITPKGGQRFLLTNKELGTRSGAERLFDLLVPLLAALTALYNRAAVGAPRLLALDEAFDRASDDNMKQFIEYLAGQNFQWIMTGPHLNISGTQVPASVRYLMLHDKGSKVATAVPKIWRSSPTKNL